MHAPVTAYTNIRIIHRIRLDHGEWGWKLHLLCWFFLTVTITITTLYYFKTFGYGGYRMANDVTTSQGTILAGLAAKTVTLQMHDVQRSVIIVLRNRLSAFWNRQSVLLCQHQKIFCLVKT